MPNDETTELHKHITTNSRLLDGVPERIPTALARELIQHYPAEVRAQSDRLASLAAKLLQRERAAVADERAARQCETRVLRDHLTAVRTELAAARHQRDELDRRFAGDVVELRKRLGRVTARVARFRKKSQSSKRSLLADVTRLIEDCLVHLEANTHKGHIDLTP